MSRVDRELQLLKKNCGAYWSDVADELKISESSLFRILRHEMPSSVRQQITMAIKAVGQKGADGI